MPSDVVDGVDKHFVLFDTLLVLCLSRTLHFVLHTILIYSVCGTEKRRTADPLLKSQKGLATALTDGTGAVRRCIYVRA